MSGILIIGGSYAANQIAASARQKGYQGPIRIVSEEPVLPYQRPPLSKGFLSGETAEDKLPLRPASFYAEQKIDVDLDTRVARIDRAAKCVETAGGRRIPYDKLALATGARPRTLGLPGAMVLRSLDDSKTLKDKLASASSVAIVGGGFIGLEAAAVCVKLGKKVTVVEAADRLLARVFPPVMSDYMAAAHRSHGVDVRLGADAKATLAALQADIVIEAIGVVPNVELAKEAGLECANGIVVDRLARTSDPDIVAAGDVAQHPSSYSDTPIRLESVQNAMDQSRTAGATLAGMEVPYDTVPWFWSDQYDLRLQMCGLSAGHDAHCVRGDMAANKFSVFYFKAGRIIGVDSVNASAEHMLARKLVAGRAGCTVEQARDAGFDLKSLLAS